MKPSFWIVCVAVLALMPSSSQAQDKRTQFGAVFAPLTLPSSASSAYAYVGVPEVGAGYRQGFGLIEFEGRAKLDYFLLALSVEAAMKFTWLYGEKWLIGPIVGVGLAYDTGARYFDNSNFRYFGIRGLVGALGTFKLGETVALLTELVLPVDFGFGGGRRVAPRAGGGIEVYLGEDITGMAMADLGFNVQKDQLGAAVVQFGYQLRLGVGIRLF